MTEFSFLHGPGARLWIHAYEAHVRRCAPPGPRRRFTASWVIARALGAPRATVIYKSRSVGMSTMGSALVVLGDLEKKLAGKVVAGHHRLAAAQESPDEDPDEGAGPSACPAP